MLALLLFLSCVTTLSGSLDDFPEPYNSERDVDSRPLPAAEAARGFRVPEGFRVEVFASEPDVRNPIAMTWDTAGRLWVAENYTYSERTLQYDLSLHDRVLVFDDPEGDGRPAPPRVFVDNVQRLTSVEVGLGGVWLMCPPRLLFVPDRDRDGVADGEPQVVLDGFHVPAENYHTVANGLRWGPDGWLYGRCGASSVGRIHRPDESPESGVPLYGGMWRYHPLRRCFEVLCHGTTNPWGHDWDEHGETFFINTVNGHLWHVIPGAHFRRPHTVSPNPGVYEPLDMHADHWHWDTGKNWTDSRSASGEHDRLGGGHAHVGATIYLGTQWPAEYRGRLLTLNLHGRRINVERLERSGSGYVARHEPDLFHSADPWFRGIDLSYGPKGDLFVLDWSDTGECHEHTGVHRLSGRIYRVSWVPPNDPAASGADATNARQDLPAATPAALVQLQTSDNEWLVRQARRELFDRVVAGDLAAESALELARPLLEADRPLVQLRGLWLTHTLHQLQQADPFPDRTAPSAAATSDTVATADREILLALLNHPDEHLRVWAVRLLTEFLPLDTVTGEPRATQVSGDPLSWLLPLAEDPSGLVRLAVASTLQRLPLEDRGGLALALARRAEDTDDANMSHLIWFGLIPVADRHPDALVPCVVQGELPRLRRWATRQLAEAMPQDPSTMGRLLEQASRASLAVRHDILRGMIEGLAGYHHVSPPESWQAFAHAWTETELEDSTAAELRSLQVVFGDGRALEEVRRLALDDSAELQQRRAALRTLIDSGSPHAREVCRQLLRVRFLNTTALQGLARYDDPEVARQLASSYRSFHPTERPAVIDALVSRRSFATALLQAVREKRIPHTDLSAVQARQIRSLGDPALLEALTEVWGELRDSPQERLRQMESWKSELTATRLAEANPSRGRQLFEKTCGNCHRLFGNGADIGPDLTGANRGDLDYLLMNVLDPSAVVNRDFMVTIFVLADGRVLNGVVISENEGTVTIQTAEKRHTILKSEIDESQRSRQSLMPDGLLQPLDRQQVVDLVAYLMSRSQVPASGRAEQPD